MESIRKFSAEWKGPVITKMEFVSSQEGRSKPVQQKW
jgi:hypothetical protein